MLYTILRRIFIFYRKQVSSTKIDAEKDGIKVPTTLQEYCIQSKPKSTESCVDMGDYFYDYGDDMDDDDDDVYEDDEDDSGNGES